MSSHVCEFSVIETEQILRACDCSVIDSEQSFRVCDFGVIEVNSYPARAIKTPSKVNSNPVRTML